MLGAFFPDWDTRGCGMRGRWGFEGFGDFWGGPKGRQQWKARAGRFFEQGDLKYVMLRLLEEKPRHGYEIIKDLQERFGGAYSPSPGTVYPTLSMLEDLGFARAMPEEGGKKIYEITEEGRRHLAEHATTVEGIFDRISRFVEGLIDAPMMEIHQAFRRLGRATYAAAPKQAQNSELLGRIRDVLDRAAQEIEQLGT